MAESELDRERDYVGGLYARLDRLKADAERELAQVRRESVGGNHQSRSERDAFARVYEDRIAQLREVGERLAFGRLELLEAPDPASPGGSASTLRYIGRLGLRDENLEPLLLDWRAPQARAFYQATAATPLGARARRHLTTRGRDVVRIEDEVFDSTLLDDDTTQLQGEGALLAALSAQRTGQMHDIVSTIQAEQDRVIRSDLSGVLVVQGGPGTGKTAVALHRAAYLLYTHRDRLGSSGVLVVGPSRAFLQYINAVLPSLGETGVVLSSLGQLYPGHDITAEDAPAVAALKGSAEMAGLIRRAMRSRQRVPAEPIDLEVNGERIVLQPQVIADAIAKARESGKPYNEGRVTFVKIVLNQLTRQLADQLRRRGSTVDDADQAYLREDLRTAYDVRVALNTAWIPLTPERLLEDLYARPQWLASLTGHWSKAKRELLRRPRGSELTLADVPLLDEAAELLGSYDVADSAAKRAAKAQHKRDLENAKRAISNMDVSGMVSAEDVVAGFAESTASLTTAERAASDRSWTYGHIVVDEAQELSPMQWRVLLRKSPVKSFTIVGDVAQASSAASSTSWESTLSPLIGDAWRLEELTVNYRTPSQIVDAAERVAEANGLVVTRSRSVRTTDWPVLALAPTDEAEQRELLVAELGSMTASGGTTAVIAPASGFTELSGLLADRLGDTLGVGVAGLSRPVALLTPADAKGLEFDSVLVVAPAAIVAESTRGASALYVAMTRPTQRLTLLLAPGEQAPVAL
ncbi:UvrD-helicase domain-containing protein [Herbiconiux sp. CPCC 203407]|uniref:UvrD-helicase domain-containing protein n=1 Tax=Herbiconiux oxytropis TaxID=2970915 RepID=A0AA41XJ18_9MICO|nr:UvrD-helicase domain-containing protein [Herbiconiux oxytropis]MCS5720558.1 UvrD-helicase domain-containing protein [Herbiconiux oxytropis]MCS5726131.1 UvrD-helicase domain-containing protein [Herbiconiux oxytropis]